MFRVNRVLTATAGMLLAWCANAYTATFHVSPTGLNVPPYDADFKAANYIGDAVLAASGYGDVILIHPGSYDIDTTIFLPAGITLQGVGRDQVTVNWAGERYEYGRMFECNGGLEITGCSFSFPFGSSHNDRITCLLQYYYGYGTPVSLKINDCRFNELAVLVGGNTNVQLFANEFFTGQIWGGVGILGYYNPTQSTAHVHGNVFSAWGAGTALLFKDFDGTGIIEHNRFIPYPDEDPFEAIKVVDSDSVSVRNNIIVRTTSPVDWLRSTGSIENNTIVDAIGSLGDWPPRRDVYVTLWPDQTLTICNNILIDVRAPFRLSPATFCPECDTTGLITFVHNIAWPPTDSMYIIDPYSEPYDVVRLLDSANAIVNPAFDQDSTYLLPYGCPLIDAGDPALLDPDGSRSDIGRWGGPEGSTYVYPDLPPAPPYGLVHDYQSPVVTLWWHRGLESDLLKYTIHRDDHAGFEPTALNQVAERTPSDTSFSEELGDVSGGVYFRIVAHDMALNTAASNEEVAVLPTGVLDDPDNEELIPSKTEITGAFPNPFNSSVVLQLDVHPQSSAYPTIAIEVFDILGRRVASAFEGQLPPGQHDIAWDGTDDSGHSLPSGVYFVRARVDKTVNGTSLKIVLLQ